MVSSDGLALQDIHNARDVILDSYSRYEYLLLN
jgi:hypothetical protein